MSPESNTAGDFSKINLSFLTTVGLTDKLSFLGVRARAASLSGNLDSSEQYQSRRLLGRALL